jgi:hypothetical protein
MDSGGTQEQDETGRVAMEVASIVLSQQYDHLFQHFHQHVLLLEDFYFSAERTVITTFELSSKLVAGVIPFSVLESEAAQTRFVKLVKAFEKASSEELAMFQKETGELRVVLQQILTKAEQTQAAEERKRKDEFNTLQTVCRREVAAFIGTIRAETAVSGLEVEAIQSLQAVLGTKVAENEALRTTLCEMTSARESERATHRAEMEREREANRNALHEDRSATTKRLHELMLDAEKMRAMHAEEIAEIYSRGNATMTRLRSEFSSRLVELDTLREALDKATEDNARERRLHQEEKNKLLKMLAELECAHEGLKLEVSAAHSDAQLQVLSYENFAESRKLFELQQFKKKVAQQASTSHFSTSASAAAMMERSASVTAPQSYSPRSLRGISVVSGVPTSASVEPASATVLGGLASSPPPYRDVSRHTGPSSSVASADRSRSPNGIPLRSPSETYLRLSNLSGSLRDSVANYGNSTGFSPQNSARAFK